jgi:CheY-like chemotaxis protein
MNLLLAEDDDNDVLLLRTLLKGTQDITLHVVNNGDEAIRYLNGEGRYADRAEFPFPHLLLLDLKMPKKNGFDVLQWIRSQPHLNPLPIVVLTSSQLETDLKMAAAYHVNSYLSKAPLAQSPEVFRNVLSYWWQYNETPKLNPTL